ncbi:MAG: RNA polymerase sigma factor SigJ [Pseudomonadota bacterium]|jgi:RNA polymerase sigma-70 factor (ECF subfamily)|nr:RNA polymerase sigma factor SigJ [Pseudomonadota bacterium]
MTPDHDPPALADRALRFDRDHGRSLRALAYRMLGSRADAEDIVQDAWLRWAAVDAQRIENDRAYLSRLVTNLCLDKLGSAAARRERYVGVWLPEPLIDDETNGDRPAGPEAQAELAQDVSVAFMLALERLSPLERAAFLLHDVFDEDFDEIGLRLGRSPVACRQLASRARQRVRADRPRRAVSDDEHRRLFDAFGEAVRNLDIDALARILADDAVLMTDGGGKVSAVPRPLRGSPLVARTLIGFARLPASGGWRLQPVRINGLPGCVVRSGRTGELMQTIALAPSESQPGRIGAIYIQRNPDKLRMVRA